MGEYAIYKGQEIKIGTCSNMYYLRWNQRHEVQPIPGNVDPVWNADELWFRVPRHEDDGIAPGDFEYLGDNVIRFYIKDEHSRFANEVKELAVANQGICQAYKKEIGVLCNIPCAHGYTIKLPRSMAYNGFSPHTLGVYAVGFRDGRASALVGCVACGKLFMRFTMEDLVQNCAPFGDHRENWEYLLQTMMEIEASLWLEYIRFNTALLGAVAKPL